MQTSWCNLNLTFDNAVVTLTLKSCQDCISETARCSKLKLGSDIGWACRCATSSFDLHLIFVLALEALIFKNLSGLYLSVTVTG